MARRFVLVIAVLLAAGCADDTASHTEPTPTTKPCTVVENLPEGADYADGVWSVDGNPFAFTIEEDELRWSTDQCAEINP